ncbi:hypothetical protein K458DRAFT_403201 [Lentithecium fluviatile CBS 122367]|uniref:Uncharacterized protein n=1 Tax=Lentithecium fluviatile CBS 122367 TaxID=1168545 RepID=A0A6G1J6K2_9PLEO|nr:hypothetical protein K458DRAFT_403201 [Lentithecium fluviatile CBS 122367]
MTPNYGPGFSRFDCLNHLRVVIGVRPALCAIYKSNAHFMFPFEAFAQKRNRVRESTLEFLNTPRPKFVGRLFMRRAPRLFCCVTETKSHRKISLCATLFCSAAQDPDYKRILLNCKCQSACAVNIKHMRFLAYVFGAPPCTTYQRRLRTFRCFPQELFVPQK